MKPSRQAFQRLKREVIYEGRVITLVRDQLLCNGHRMQRDTVLHPGSVVIIPMVDREHLVLVRQYRRAVERMLLELPAGTLGTGELPLRCAKRELAEETGWTAKTWTRLGGIYPAPGLLSEKMTFFLATGLQQQQAHPEPDEILVPVVVSLKQAFAAIRSGEICDAKTMIGVQWAADPRLRPR